MKWCIAILLFLVGTMGAFGQSAEFSASVGKSLLGNPGLGTLVTGKATSSDLKLTDGFRIGFRLTLNSYRFFGHEIGYAYNRSHLKFENPAQSLGMAIHQGSYSFLGYGTPEGFRVRPFAAAGVHFDNFTPPGSSATSGQGSNKFGYNYGGGLKVRVSSILGIRFDLRQYITGKPFDFLINQHGILRQTEVSAGVAFLL